MKNNKKSNTFGETVEIKRETIITEKPKTHDKHMIKPTDVFINKTFQLSKATIQKFNKQVHIEYTTHKQLINKIIYLYCENH